MWKQSAPGSPVEETARQGQFKTQKIGLSLESEPRKKRVGFSGVFLSLWRVCRWGASQWARLLSWKTPKRQVWAASSQHPPLLMPHSSFLSFPCQWPLWTIRGWLSQRLTPQHLNLWPGSSNSQGSQPRNKILLKLEHAFCHLFITDCDWGLYLSLFMI